MPFNPTIPTDGSLMVAEEMRDQYNGLADIIAEQGTLISAQESQIVTLEARVSALEGAINGLALNPYNVFTSGEYINDPPTGPQVQVILDLLNQLITSVKRP